MSQPINASFDTYVTKYPLLANLIYSAAADDTIYQDITDAKGPDWSPIPDGVETHITYGLDVMARRSDESPFTFDTPGPEGTKKSYHSNYGLAVEFTENLFMDGMYGIIEKVVADLGNAYNLTRNLQVANFYDDAFTGSVYTAYDGQAIMSTSHTSQPGVTRANMPNPDVPLSWTGAQTIVTLMRRFKNERGRPSPKVKSGQTIKVLIPPEMEFAADKIFDGGAAYQPDSPNNTINVLKKFRWSVMQNPYLTSTVNFFFMPDGETMIRLCDKQKMTPDKYPSNPTKGVVQDIRGRWLIHPEHWDHLFGSKGTS